MISCARFDWLDQTLADGRSFLQGPAAGLADLAAYHPVWFLRQNFGSAAAPLGFPRLLTWAERIAAIGHGSRSQMSAQQALGGPRPARTHALARISGHHALHRASSFPNLERAARGGAVREPILPTLCRCADRRHEGKAGCRASPPWQADRLARLRMIAFSFFI